MINSLNNSMLTALKNLSDGRKIVFGEGNQNASLMFIGEAPGGDEERLGRPFVGKAGKNLDKILEKLEINREDVYISNVVKVRPTRISIRGTVSNRAPNEDEITIFTPWLNDEIKLISPKIIATLGNTPLQALFGSEYKIGSYHSVVLDYNEKTKVFPLYHPASLIYKPDLLPVYEQDILKLKQILGGL